MRAPILFGSAADVGRRFADRWRGQPPTFACVLSHTDTCLLPGVSAAGISEELRPLTPAADAEVVCLGAAMCLPTLPSNPSGAPGPAGITRAALQLGNIQARFVAVGLRVWPATPYVRVEGDPGGSIERGGAVPRARTIFDAGLAIGHQLVGQGGYVVLGESVPGGTTTALALLLAMGYAAEGRVSGSLPGNAHMLKTRVARAGLAAAGLAPGDGRDDPLGAVAEVGDPMQPLAAGIAAGVVRAGGDVLLAGGSQMLAVAALLAVLQGADVFDRLAIGTTRWIVQDPAADVLGLAADISTDLALLAANLDFSRSRHAVLHAYEQGMVKEGVGAGGACIAAMLCGGLSVEELETAIDETYAQILG